MLHSAVLRSNLRVKIILVKRLWDNPGTVMEGAKLTDSKLVTQNSTDDDFRFCSHKVGMHFN